MSLIARCWMPFGHSDDAGNATVGRECKDELLWFCDIGKFAISDFSMAVIQANQVVCYIVYLGAHSHGPTPSSIDLETATHFHYDFLGSILGSHEKAKEAIIYSYNKQINGFAAAFEEEEAADIAENPNTVSVFLSKEHKLHTTRSWEFLGLQRNGRNTTWQKGRFGENTIISNIDTNSAAVAITTTDLVSKSVAIESLVGGTKLKVGGMAKGSGMIHPNMDTMLGV
ncbi:Subtilisin-like protease [Glycine max]|nr:Subtilisin-like protease [Glycine max]